MFYASQTLTLNLRNLRLSATNKQKRLHLLLFRIGFADLEFLRKSAPGRHEKTTQV
jgi:hypothetical protein